MPELAATSSQISDQNKMKIRWGGTFVKPALDYRYFKWTLQFQPKPPETSCVSPLNTVVFLIVI